MSNWNGVIFLSGAITRGADFPFDLVRTNRPSNWGKGRSQAAVRRRKRRRPRDLEELAAALLRCYPHADWMVPTPKLGGE